MVSRRLWSATSAIKTRSLPRRTRLVRQVFNHCSQMKREKTFAAHSLNKMVVPRRYFICLLFSRIDDLFFERCEEFGSILVAKSWKYPGISPSQIFKHRIFAPLYSFPVNHERLS